MGSFNIIIVNDFAYINGGAAKVAIVSAIELSRKGYNVTFFSAVGPICNELKNSKVNVICLNQNDILHDKNRVRAFFTGIWNIKAGKAMKNLLNNYDDSNTIVHVHGFMKSLTSSVIRAVINKRFKMVVTLHDYFVSCPNGGLYNYKTEKICKVKPMSIKCAVCNCDSRHYYHKIWRTVRQLVQISIASVPNKVKNYIYISQINKNVLKKYLPLNANYYYVRNPIDVQKEKRVEAEKNNIFVYVGRLSEEKGVLLFAKAAKILNCDALFIGDGELKETIKQFYPNVKLTGWLDKSDVNNYLQKSRCLVFPSLWYEGLPLTVLEAKSKGIPVIVSDECSGREVIKDRQFGLWFKRNNIEDLVSKMSILMDDNTLVSNISKATYRDYWNDSYDLETHINMLLECYNELK